MQLWLPVSIEELPARQAEQPTAPARDAYFPGVQVSHAPEPEVEEYLPAPHSVQLGEVGGANDPAAQAEQREAPVGEYVPFGHGEQLVLAGFDWYMPAEQFVHET